MDGAAEATNHTCSGNWWLISQMPRVNGGGLGPKKTLISKKSPEFLFRALFTFSKSIHCIFIGLFNKIYLLIIPSYYNFFVLKRFFMYGFYHEIEAKFFSVMKISFLNFLKKNCIFSIKI